MRLVLRFFWQTRSISCNGVAWKGRTSSYSKGKEFLMSWDEKVVTSWRLFVLGGQRLICSRFWSDHFIEPLRSWWWSLYWEDREGHWVGPSRGFQSSRFMHSTHAMEIRGRRSTLKRTKTTYRIPCMGGFQNPQAPGIIHVHRKALHIAQVQTLTESWAGRKESSVHINPFIFWCCGFQPSRLEHSLHLNWTLAEYNCKVSWNGTKE